MRTGRKTLLISADRSHTRPLEEREQTEAKAKSLGSLNS